MMSNCPVERWCNIITGYTQHGGTPTLLNSLAHELENRFCGPGVRVRQHAWNDNWTHYAEAVRRSSTYAPKVVAVGYSWGGGWGLVKLAQALDGYGIKIAKAVLVDPVYRHPYPWGQWRAFLPFIPIAIPANVGEVWQFRQTTNWPCGHRLMAEDPKATTIHDARIVINARHDQMDDHATCINFARQIAEGVLSA